MTKNSESDSYHEDLDELIAGYVLGNLDEAELTWLNRHLVKHPELTEQIQQLQTTLNLLPYSLPEVIPSNNLKDNILTKAQSQTFSHYKFARWGWIMSGFATLTTLWFGLQSYSLRQQLARVNIRLQQQQELVTLMEQGNNRLVSFEVANKSTSASGSLFIAPESHKAVLALQNLESLSGAKVYRLWAISPGKKTGCANFIPDEQGKVHLELSNDALNNANSLLITIEPQADTAQPQGNAVLTSFSTAI